MRKIRVKLGEIRGSVMLILLMVVVIISIIAFLVLAASHYNNKISSNERHRKRAFYVAESGAMMAIDSLNNNDQIHGIIYTDEPTNGGSFSVEILDSSDVTWLSSDERIIRSIGVSRNGVRRLEYRIKYAVLGYGDIPGPLYIEAEEPAFPGNVFTVQGGDHQWGDAIYNIPVPPGEHRAAVSTIHDSSSIVDAIGMRADQVFTVDDFGNVIEGSVNPQHDTLDLEALAAAYAGPNGELADTIGWVAGAFPNDYKVSYLDGDFTVAGGGHVPSGGSSQYPCPNCNGTGVVTCWGCDGTGYEWQSEACPDCNGTGLIGCATCDSLGYLVCPDCAGTGGTAIMCDSCLGTGIYGCAICAGTGDCPICHGTGISKTAGLVWWSCYRCGTGGKNDPPGTGLCPDCSGTGGVSCPFCGGTGVDPTSGCPTCGGSGSIICPDCVGLGYTPCPTCGGSGGVGPSRICNVCGGPGTQVCPWCLGAGTVNEEGGGQGPGGTLGAGVLVVTGNLHISGQFEYSGLIIVLGEVSVDITGGGQGVHIWGSLLCQSVDFKINGNADICWSSQVLQNLPDRPAGYQVQSVTEY
ncbi:hypothetical protein KAH81_01840 [bacterium]|nr:hypothetical protein [bacterium]